MPPEIEAIADQLTECDREPIHIPGAIQPHGLLLVAERATGEVIAGAGDIERKLSSRWLGQPLELLLARDIDLTALALGPILVEDVPGIGATFVASLSLSGNRILAELEPTPDLRRPLATTLADVETAQRSLEKANGLRDLCHHAAGVMQGFTGFDRVMIYRFLDDGSGSVVAEARGGDHPSFLNHHFPASDIPQQARALYIRNRIRVIPDIDYAPAPIRPAEANEPPIDLADIGIRSVSPVHVQYLRNMGVAASASISIVKDGVLWGLVACHNFTPRGIPLEVRLICQSLAAALAQQIRAKEEAELYRDRVRLRSSEDAVLAKLGRDTSFEELFKNSNREVRMMLGADGFAALQGDQFYCDGECPPRELAEKLARWREAADSEAAFATAELPSEFPMPADAQRIASGLLAVVMPTEPVTHLMWFRAEQLQNVNWAGNPHKGDAAGAGGVLTPRTSFEAWSQTVTGQSREWTLAEIESAKRLARALGEERRNQQLRQLNKDLFATNEANQRLLRQKDYLLKEIDHRVQNSLQLVSAFLRLQSKSVGDGALSQQLDEAQRRLNAVALVHKRLYTDDGQTVDLARYIESLFEDLLSSMDPAWQQHSALELAPILVPAPRAVNIGLILTEIVINTQKYAYGGGPGPLAIILEQHRNRFRLIVADRGRGKDGEAAAGSANGNGGGFGSRMLAALIERLDGEIEERSNQPGLRTIVTAPIA